MQSDREETETKRQIDKTDTYLKDSGCEHETDNQKLRTMVKRKPIESN